MTQTAHHRPTLVLGGTGTTGRRLVGRLTRRDIRVRIGSRSSGPSFDREQPSTWGPVFQDAEAAYTHVPDLVLSDPTDAIAGVVETALAGGTRRLVLLSGQGGERAGACEEILMSSGADRTILRAGSFHKNASAGHLPGPILVGEVTLPAGDVGEALTDTDDIAEATDGVARILGRPARDFAACARATAATGVWAPTDRPNPGDPR